MYDGTLKKLRDLENKKQQTMASLTTIANGAEVNVANHTLVIDGTSTDKTFRAFNTITNTATFDLSFALFEDAAKSIMATYFFADYRRVKQHATFQKLYNYEPQGFAYYFDPNNSKAPKAIPCATFPCMRCGLVLPENNITIDHQKPQEGGEVLAVAKAFRAIGMTQEGPKGAKGKAFAKLKTYTEMFWGLQKNDFGEPIGPHPRNKFAGVDRTKRQSLDEQGTVTYSTLLWGGDKPDLYRICMNSVLNLKPLCLRCNTSKGNIILGD